MQEIEVTRRLLEVSQLREEQSKKTIQQLETDVSQLRKMVEEDEELRLQEGLTLQQLIDLKKQLSVDNVKLSDENQTYSQQIALLEIELREANADKKRLDERISFLCQEMMVCSRLRLS